MSLDQIEPCLAFFDWIMHNRNNEGPFLCVLAHETLFDWYEKIKELEDRVVVAYRGPREGRGIARDLDSNFRFLLTTMEILIEDMDWFQTIEFEVMAGIDIE
jgi:chromodomain-helicase-DNA-binding protein 1